MLKAKSVFGSTKIFAKRNKELEATVRLYETIDTARWIIEAERALKRARPAHRDHDNNNEDE
jgi:hypothetical protein